MDQDHQPDSVPSQDVASTPQTKPSIPTLRQIPLDEHRGVRTSSSMSWLVGMLAFLLLATHLVPLAVERLRYAWVRGRQQAEYDVAGDVLKRVRFDDLSRAFRLVSQRVSPSVVHISCNSAPALSTSPNTVPGFRFPHADQGSGVIMDDKGYILTNRHVVINAEKIQVRLADSRRFDAWLVGEDALTDLAVLKIEADNMTAATWGDSDELSVGSMVWAVGSPFGLVNSITFGILSGKHRASRIGKHHQDFLQTDAAVNPGNSGGPLVDIEGRVIGINTAIVGEAYQGVSFAVPSRVAKRVYNEIRENGEVPRGWLGVMPMDLTASEAKEFGLDKPGGARVGVVVAEQGGRLSPAQRAGLQVDDVIVRWGDRTIRTAGDLFRAVAETPPGKQIEVILIREKKRETLVVEVEKRRPSLP